MDKHLNMIFRIISDGLKDGTKPSFMIYSILTYIYMEDIKEQIEKGVKNENKL